MATFLHGGDLGDLIYALPAIRGAGGGVLYLSETAKGREALTAERRAVILPLLQALDYIEEVRVHQGEKVDFDFTGFRQHLRSGERNIAETQLEFLGLPRQLAAEPWIDAAAFRQDEGAFAIVVHRGARYHNPLFPWKEFVRRFGRRCVFVGFSQEYLSFVRDQGSVLMRPTANLLEMAQLIASCTVFFGNQSVGYALAEAMKRPAVLEACPYPGFLDCRFARENVIEVLAASLPWQRLEALLAS